MTCIVDMRELTDFSDVELLEAEKSFFISDKNEKRRRESLVGRILLGYMLEKNYGIKKFSFIYGENEKPYLEKENVFFNISHSDNLVMCSIGEEEIGCDIQEIRTYNPKVAKRFYCEKEMELIEDSDNKDREFIRLWALKESILKKEGTGLQGGLTSYDFSAYYRKDSFSLFGNRFDAFSIDGYEAAVCSLKGEEKIEITEKGILTEYIHRIKNEKT